MPWDEYAADGAVSSSRLRLAMRSPAHYRAGFQGTESKAMRDGSDLHGVVCTPAEIIQKYAAMPNFANDEGNITSKGERSFSRATTYVREREEAWRKLNPGKKEIDQETLDRLLGVSTALGQCPVLFDLRFGGEGEVSIFWTDDKTGLRCKGRIDWLAIQKNQVVILDYKTSRDVAGFEKSLATYRYDLQMRFYQRGLEALGYENVVPWICAVETQEPFGHRVAKVDPDALAAADAEIDRLLELVADCTARDEWVSYSHPESWQMPSWFKRSASESIELVIDGEVLSV
jgi:hypothetical protein